MPSAKPAGIEAWLEQLGQPSADRDYLPGHARMLRLLESMPPFRPRLRIRIAGTNGKGSTAHMLANALHAAGLKVGLYTSPHILHFNERIRINGEPVADDRILAALERLMPTALACGASYFETATAVALMLFADAGVDVEILEAGVGARLDATTAVPADMALITPIALDHQAWLGDSLESVAEEKSYVADGCVAVLSAAQSDMVLPILKNRAAELEIVEPDASLSMSMPGSHQLQNGALALQAVKRMMAKGWLKGSMELAKQAIESTVVPGRLQKVLVGEATLWLDAAHNLHGVEALLPTLPQLADPFDAILVFTREDRELSGAASLLRPLARKLYGNRGEGFDRSFDDPATALHAALDESPMGTFLALGSFVTLAAILRAIDAD